MEYKEILYSVEEGIATITLNHPRLLNAIGGAMQREVARALEQAQADPEVKVVMLTGAGRAFCAGVNPRDLDQIVKCSIPELEEYLRRGPIAIAMAAEKLEKPLLAAVNGPAVGLGMDLASICDIRLASQSARFGMLYVRTGAVPRMGGCYLLPRIVGLATALELIWTGRLIDAQEALGIGYVSRVLPPAELLPATRELARQLAKSPSLVIRLTKGLIYGSWRVDFHAALEAALQAATLDHVSEDAVEGPRAWLEKREPVFKGH